MSRIEWTDLTWNPVWGCTHGCGYCYARSVAKRFAAPVAAIEDAKNPVSLQRANLEQHLADFRPVWLQSQYDKPLPKAGRIVFVGSMSDIADWLPNWVDSVMEKIRRHPQHVFLFLTKRPELLRYIIWPENAWVGISAENQAAFDKRAAQLIHLNAPHKFLSAEPMIGPVVLGKYIGMVEWVIVGGMTGPRARGVDENWARSLANECEVYGVPFFFKQWGGRGVESMRKPIRREFPKEFPIKINHN